jgi:hypothetical protein
LPVDNIDDLRRAAERLNRSREDLLTLKFAISESEKAEAAVVCAYKAFDPQVAAKGLQGELKPLLWDDLHTCGVVYYRKSDKGFWIMGKKELRMVGHRWTDLIEPQIVFWDPGCWNGIRYSGDVFDMLQHF